MLLAFRDRHHSEFRILSPVTMCSCNPASSDNEQSHSVESLGSPNPSLSPLPCVSEDNMPIDAIPRQPAIFPGELVYNLDDLDDLNNLEEMDELRDLDKINSLGEIELEKSAFASTSRGFSQSQFQSTPSHSSANASTKSVSNAALNSSIRDSLSSSRSIRRSPSISSGRHPHYQDELNGVYSSLFQSGYFPVIVNLVNLYPHGGKIQLLVNSILSEQSEYYDLLQHLQQIRTNIMLATNQTEQKVWKEIGVKLLQEYFLLITIGIYLHSTQSSSPAISFEEWFSGHQSIGSLYETITLSRINQYLSVSVEELPYVSMKWAVNATAGYLNVHSLLLQQRVCDQENQVIAKKLVMSVKSRHSLFGTIFTKSIVRDYVYDRIRLVMNRM